MIATESDLPSLYRTANRQSLAGQRLTLLCSKLRFGGAILAAVAGALSWRTGRYELWGFFAVAGFALALIAELVMLMRKPETDWYDARAVAESAKTLAWRYAVGGDPFPAGLQTTAAQSLLRDRLAAIANQGGNVVTSDDWVSVTDGMLNARSSTFAARQASYIEGRVRDQQRWYARKASFNKRRATIWRGTLLGCEVVGLALAAGRGFGAWEIDWSGVIAAGIASGAAWLNLKQHSTLAAAYTVAATELGLSQERLSNCAEENWHQLVADTEEAVSREHTMWHASRSH